MRVAMLACLGWCWDLRLDIKTTALLTGPLAAPDRAGAGGRNPPRQNFSALNLLVVTPQRNAGSRSVSGVACAVWSVLSALTQRKSPVR